MEKTRKVLSKALDEKKKALNCQEKLANYRSSKALEQATYRGCGFSEKVAQILATHDLLILILS